MKTINTIFLSCLFMTLSAFAGPSVVGNGGNGVFLEEKFYVLDLVESDSHIQPFMKDHSVAFYYDRIKYALHAFQDPALVRAVSQKITELGALDLIYTEALLRTFEAVRWNLVDYRLVLMPVITPVAAQLHQIAIRTSDNILIDQQYWNQLNIQNRAALLIHEANFILIRPSPIADDTAFQKSAFQSRLLTGYLFSNSMSGEYPKSFVRRLSPLFPSVLTEVDAKPVFAVYRTKALSAFAIEDVITANPYLEILFSESKIKVTVSDLSVNELTAIVCKRQTLPNVVQLKTHVMHLELYKGDNNTQDYISFFPASDEGFPKLNPVAATCEKQVAKFHQDLVRHID